MLANNFVRISVQYTPHGSAMLFFNRVALHHCSSCWPCGCNPALHQNVGLVAAIQHFTKRQLPMCAHKCGSHQRSTLTLKCLSCTSAVHVVHVTTIRVTLFPGVHRLIFGQLNFWTETGYLKISLTNIEHNTKEWTFLNF